jgi:hypothetical protein
VIERPRATVNRSNPVPNDVDIIDLGASSDDIGERQSPSPDPSFLLPQRVVHLFETPPTECSSSVSNKRKRRAKELFERAEGSEEEEDDSEELLLL